MVPANAGTYCPGTLSNQVFDKRRLLQVRPAVEEVECRRRAVVKLGGVCDLIAEFFMQKCCIAFNPCLDLLVVTMQRIDGLEIPFAKVVMLERNDWCRRCI